MKKIVLSYDPYFRILLLLYENRKSGSEEIGYDNFFIKCHIEKPKYQNFYTLSKNIPSTFSVSESKFLLIFGQSGVKFNAKLIHSLMEDRVTLLKNFCTASIKRLMKQMFINKIQHKSPFNMKNFLSEYVDKTLKLFRVFVFIVANNTF